MDNIKEALEIIDSLTCNKKYYDVFSNQREQFYTYAKVCLNNNYINQEDENFILNALFINNFKDFNYEETEKYANLIKDRTDLRKPFFKPMQVNITSTKIITISIINPIVDNIHILLYNNIIIIKFICKLFSKIK